MCCHSQPESASVMFSTRTPRVQTAPCAPARARSRYLRHMKDPRRPIRLPEYASSDRAALDTLLDTARVGHFALVAEDGTPAVIPTMVVRDRDRDRVLAHGSTGSRWMRRLATGVPTALA